MWIMSHELRECGEMEKGKEEHPRVMLSCFCMDVCPAEWNVQVVFAYSESTAMFVMSYLWPISWCGCRSGGHSCLT